MDVWLFLDDPHRDCRDCATDSIAKDQQVHDRHCKRHDKHERVTREFFKITPEYCNGTT
jgi:hypothetical protein